MHDLITSLAFIVMKAVDEIKDKTTAPNQLWQTDFTYFKVTGWATKAWTTAVVLLCIHRRRVRSPIGICKQMPVGQGKRWHQTLKNCILLENYYLPGDLELKIADFVSHDNHLRYHESIAKLTPDDVYIGRS